MRTCGFFPKILLAKAFVLSIIFRKSQTVTQVCIFDKPMRVYQTFLKNLACLFSFGGIVPSSHGEAAELPNRSGPTQVSKTGTTWVSRQPPRKPGHVVVGQAELGFNQDDPERVEKTLVFSCPNLKFRVSPPELDFHRSFEDLLPILSSPAAPVSRC